MNLGFNAIGESAIGEIYQSNNYTPELLEFIFTIPVYTPELLEFTLTIPVVNYTPELISFKFTIPVIANSQSVVVNIENPETPVYGNY